MPAAKLRLTRFVAVQVRDWSRAVVFYRDVLGLRLQAGNDREVRFEGDSITLFVERLAEDSPVPARHPGKSFFEFETTDFESSKNALIEAGCTLTEPTSAAGSAMFADPFGLSFHVYQHGAALPEINTIRIECVFKGRVQGVGFRQTALRIAARFGGVHGWVRNERDGSVAMSAEGTIANVEAFIAAVKNHWREHLESVAETRSHCEGVAGGFSIR